MSHCIAVAGAGIGGLSCALALAKQGFKVTIYEQAQAISEVGAGLQLSPNAVHVLDALGLSPSLQEKVFRPQHAVMRHYQSAKRYFSVPLYSRCEQRFGAPYWHVHRADLQQALYQACVDSQVEICLSSQVLDYTHREDKAGVILHFANQQQAEADVLIGADGIHSAVQHRLLDNLSHTAPPRFTGQVAWRGTIHRGALPPGLVEPDASLWVGPGKHFVTYYLRGGELINFVAVEERSDWLHESWNMPGDVDYLRQLFGDWHPQVREILAAVSDCFLWALYDRAPLPAWVDKHVALLGDACHPMLPFLAQGAAMAIEDSYVLATMLTRNADINLALQAYQQQRLTRCSHIQAVARQQASLYHMRTLADRTKLAVLAGLSGSGLNNWLATNKLDALYAHNVVEQLA